MSESPFVTEGGVTRLTRLKDGRVMCCICFEYRHKDELAAELVDGLPQTYDVCKGVCATQAGMKEVDFDTRERTN